MKVRLRGVNGSLNSPDGTAAMVVLIPPQVVGEQNMSVDPSMSSTGNTTNKYCGFFPNVSTKIYDKIKCMLSKEGKKRCVGRRERGPIYAVTRLLVMCIPSRNMLP